MKTEPNQNCGACKILPLWAPLKSIQGLSGKDFDPCALSTPALFCVFNFHPAPAVVLKHHPVLCVKMFSSPFLGLVKDSKKKNPLISSQTFFFFFFPLFPSPPHSFRDDILPKLCPCYSRPFSVECDSNVREPLKLGKHLNLTHIRCGVKTAAAF